MSTHKKKLPVTWPRLTGDVHQWWPGKRWWQKPGPWCRTKASLGRRGGMLLLLGLTYVLIGYREIQAPADTLPGAWLFLVPGWLRAAAWATTGIVACYLAVNRPHPARRPVSIWRTDTFGWLALYIMPMVTILSYATSFVLWIVFDFGAVPPHVLLQLHGNQDAWSNAILRVPFIIVALICSGWKENPPRGDCR